jgi:hypothetical protein
MYIGKCPIPGAYTHAHFTRILPPPNEDTQRRLWGLVCAAGLSVDPSIGARDLRIKYCILLPAAGMLVTATRTHAPLLEPNCADLARVTSLDVLLLRFGPRSSPEFEMKNVRACLIQHDPCGHIVAREGYRASVPSHGGILLCNPLPKMPDWHVSHEGMMMSVGADLAKASASTPETASPRSE